MNDDVDLREESEMDAWLRREGEAARAARNGCPHPDALLARRSEFVSPAVRERIEAHLAGCQACTRLVAGFEQLHLDEADGSVAARVLERVTAPVPSRVGWLLPLAAGLVLLIGAGLWWRIAVPHEIVPQTARTSTTAPLAPAPSAPSAPLAPAPSAPSAPLAPAPLAPSAPSAPSAPVALWTIEPFPVTLAITSLDASRGSSGASRAPSRELVDALLTYEHGDYVKAAEQLAAVTSAHPESGDAWLYLGVAQLMADRPADAIAPLARAADTVAAERRDAVAWYRAAAEQRTGRAEDARARVADMCGRPGTFHDRACAAAARLQ